jgi:signal transduction histidine kinase
MLYLFHMPNPHGDGEERTPISHDSALQLERALLAIDDAGCRRALRALFQRDHALANWAKHVAARRTGHEPEADPADWCGESLVAEMAAALCVATVEQPEPNSIEWRLPALVARLSTFDRKLELAKIESLKELAYGASHEINNPLANIAARAQTLCDGEPDPERQRKLLAIHRQAMRAHEMISDLMLFARPPKLEFARCDLRHVIKQVVEELRPLAAQRATRLACDAGPLPIEAAVDANQLAVAISALVTNAVEATGSEGVVDIAMRQTTHSDKQVAEITVQDDGPGISARAAHHMFDPFFSGREAGRGLGFGLSKCWRIVTDHGGEVMASSPVSGGAQFVIRLPL